MIIQESLYAIIELLIAAKSITLNWIWLVGWCFYKKNRNYFLNFILLQLKLSCYHCTIVLKKQSEHSGLSPDMRSLIVPTSVIKLTESLCSGWFFFQTNFDFLTSLFWQNYYTIQKLLLSCAQIWKNISPLIFFRKVRRFKDCHFGQFGTNNARYVPRY